MKKKTAPKPISKKRTQMLVNMVRGAMKLFAPQMVDMTKAVGKDTWFETEVGKVRALTYGFENQAVEPLLVNIHGSGFTLGSAVMDDALKGSLLNLEYTLENGQTVKLLNDNKIYLGTQLHKKKSDRYYGIVADDKCILVCEYGQNRSDPKIILYEQR